MAVTLAEAKNNTTTDLDVAVIDEFRKESVILDSLIFHTAVNPAGGGDTMDYGYRRLSTQATASFRAINTEYTPQNVVTTKHTVTLAVLGGSFEVDRVTAKLGPAASGVVSLNMSQKIKAPRTLFQDAVVNGDVAVDANGFDGLDKILTGTSTEFRPNEVSDFIDHTVDAQFQLLTDLDYFLSTMDGTPTVVIANKAVLGIMRGLVRRTGMYVKEPIEGLVGANGRPIMMESYGGIIFADPGEKAGSTAEIIPIETRTVNAVSTTGLTDIYAYRVGLDGFFGVATTGGQLVSSWLPKWDSSGAVKKGEVELGPIGVALRATKAAAVWRNVKVR